MDDLLRFFNSDVFDLLRFEGKCAQFALVSYSRTFSESWFKLKAKNI